MTLEAIWLCLVYAGVFGHVETHLGGVEAHFTPTDVALDLRNQTDVDVIMKVW